MPAVQDRAVSRSKLLARFPDLFHGIFVGERIRVDARQGGHQRVYDSVTNIVRGTTNRSVSVAMNVLVHGDRVTRVNTFRYAPQRADGLVTSLRGMYLAVTSADCVPVYMFDPKRRIVGLGHAGWKGIARGIVANLIATMARAGSSPSDLIVWLGPSAKECCYDATDQRYRYRRTVFERRFGKSVLVYRRGKTYLDLPRAIVRDCLKSGIRRAHVEIDSTCTIHDPENLPSDRRERSNRKRTLFAIAGLADPVDSIKGKRVLVMGLGLHGGGVDTVKWLCRQGARVTVTDLKTAKALRPSLNALKGLRVALVLGTHRFSDVRASDLIVASPGVPRESPYLRYAHALSIPVENDASIFFARSQTPIIGITGTKGKTTTATLASAMLRKSRVHVLAVGHHEVPLLSFLERTATNGIVVAELSSWRLERMALRSQSPHIAVVTNVMPDHLDRYREFADYVRAKRGILDHQHTADHAILNRDNPVARRFGRNVRSHRWWFSTHPFPEENGAFIDEDVLFLRDKGVIRRIGSLRADYWNSRHRRENLLAAVLCAWLAGATRRAIATVIESPPLVPHRMELVRIFRGIRYINDSAATTPEATLAALSTVSKPIVLIAGGTDKKLQYDALRKSIATRCNALIALQGTATRKLLRGMPREIPVRAVRTMAGALKEANAFATRGATVLLSPGAASFGLFKHEFDRGDQFRALVRAMR